MGHSWDTCPQITTKNSNKLQQNDTPKTLMEYVIAQAAILSPETDEFALRYRLKCEFNYRDHNNKIKKVDQSYTLNSLEEMIFQLIKFRHSEFDRLKFSDNAALSRFANSLREIKARGIVDYTFDVLEEKEGQESDEVVMIDEKAMQQADNSENGRRKSSNPGL